MPPLYGPSALLCWQRCVEHAPRAVVHLYGEVDRQFMLTGPQLRPDAVVEFQDVGDRVELREAFGMGFPPPVP
jgi:hypothetical protein